MEKSKEKIIIYGTGGSAKFYFETDFDSEKFELVGFCDSNSNKWNTKFLGYPVISPMDLQVTFFETIIIASVFVEQITEKLILEVGVAREKIQNKYYRQIEKIRKRYEDFYTKNGKLQKSNSRHIIKKTDKIVIYTAIAGDYDDLKEPTYVDKRCKYICFSDNPLLSSRVWEIRPLEIVNGDYNRSAKRLKILPQLFFQEYDWSIWVDGTFEIIDDLTQLIDKYALNSNFLSFMHNKRSCIYEEAIALEKGSTEKSQFDYVEVIRSQMERYQEEKFPDDNELLAGGILFRKHNSPEMIGLMEKWWNEIITSSKRDQLSFNYCAWKANIFCDMIDLNIFDNPYVKAYAHNKKH